MHDVAAVLPAFLLGVLLISASPGPAMILILRRAAGGFRSAVPTVLGIEVGLFIWAMLAATGITALIAMSEIAYTVLRVVGAAFLVYLGVRAWISAWRLRDGSLPGVDENVPPRSPKPWRNFVEGVGVQLANPKAAVFMLAFYPQFVPSGAEMFTTTATLATIQVTVETMLYLGLAYGVSRASAWFGRTHIRRRMEAVTGTVLISLGLRVALDRG